MRRAHPSLPRRARREASIAFDDTDYQDPPLEPPPPPPTGPRLSKRDETILVVILTVCAFSALLLPISAGGFADVVRALTTR